MFSIVKNSQGNYIKISFSVILLYFEPYRIDTKASNKIKLQNSKKNNRKLNFISETNKNKITIILQMLPWYMGKVVP